MPVAARSKLWACGHSFAGITDSNPAGDMDFCLLWALCIVTCGSMRRADHSSRGVVPSVIVKSGQWVDHGPLGAVTPWKKVVLMEMIQVARNISSCKGIRNLFLASSLVKKKSSTHSPFFWLHIRCDWMEVGHWPKWCLLLFRSGWSKFHTHPLPPPHPRPQSVTNDQIFVCVLATRRIFLWWQRWVLEHCVL